MYDSKTHTLSRGISWRFLRYLKVDEKNGQIRVQRSPHTRRMLCPVRRRPLGVSARSAGSEIALFSLLLNVRWRALVAKDGAQIVSRNIVTPACRVISKTVELCAFCGRTFRGSVAHRQHYDGKEGCGDCCGCVKWRRDEKESREENR
jgi:hypothetical protein